MRPVIGLTPDEGTTTARPGRPERVRLELADAYVAAVDASGGLPIILPLLDDGAACEALVARLDALVLTGGGFDIDPALYGDAPREGLGPLKPRRTRCEWLLLEAALRRGIPVLGVCGGMQLINVVLGGTLHQDLPRERPDGLEHQQPHDPALPAHAVQLTVGSRLERICDARQVEVNSTHHQAVQRLAEPLIVSGVSSDGLVEAFELLGDRFVVGVQWHPERLGDRPAGAPLWRALVRAAREGVR